MLSTFLLTISLAVANAAPTPDLDLAKADTAFKLRRDHKKGLEALSLYRELKKRGNLTTRAIAGMWEWLPTLLAIASQKDKAEQETLFAEGRDASLHGVDQDKKCAECYFWGAINMALYAETVGVVKMLFSLGSIQDLLKKSIELNPNYTGAGAYRLLGIFNYKLPGLLGGSNRRAKEFFQNAIEFGSDEPLNYLFLARLNLWEYEDKNAALTIAKKGALITPPTYERVEAQDAMVDLKNFITELEKTGTVKKE